jgi:ferredoxin
MPEKYHIETRPAPPRNPRIGKFGVMDWREDCARCQNCVKKACTYDRHRQEMEYIRRLSDVDALFFECMGCFSCIQDCTKNLLGMAVNPVYERLGNSYWTPDIIRATWLMAETARIPVSGAGYGGPFSGPGFDSMWTDMSEIVRPTRDGIHGREYISTSVDIGRKPPFLKFGEGRLAGPLPPLVSIPMPLMLDIIPPRYAFPDIEVIRVAAAANTGVLALVDSRSPHLAAGELDSYLRHIALSHRPGDPLPPVEILERVPLVEFTDDHGWEAESEELMRVRPDVVVSVRVDLRPGGVERAIELARGGADVVRAAADPDGAEIASGRPRFVKDMVRTIHTTLVNEGIRDGMTLIAGGGVALPEHMAKAIICGADLVTVDLPSLVALECRLCARCEPDHACPAGIERVEFDYGVQRITNLIAAWHGQLIEVMGAMGMREVRRLRGDVGRAMFFEEIEEDTFGRIFGERKKA